MTRPAPADENTSMFHDDELIPATTDAARMLHVHAVTMRRFLREGRLPAVKIGKQWLIRRGTLAAIARGEISLSAA